MLVPKFDEILAFQLTAESCSFAVAAKILGRDTSVISRRVASLERTLGAKLIVRSSREVRLTKAGTHYLQRLTPIIADIVAAGKEAAQIDKMEK